LSGGAQSGVVLPMQVELKVESIWSTGMESDGMDRVSWIVSGERAWTSMVCGGTMGCCGRVGESKVILYLRGVPRLATLGTTSE
jgi:hypothetical protein